MTIVENCATKTNGRSHLPNFAKLEAAEMTQSFKDSVKDTTCPFPQLYYRALQESNALETDTVNKSKITSNFRTTDRNWLKIISESGKETAFATDAKVIGP